MVLILLVSCSTKTLNFSGESTNWKGNYSPTINTKENREQGYYELRFKGNKIKDNIIDELIIENKGKTTKITDFSLQNGLIKVPVSCSHCTISNKDTSIKIKIKWDNIEETFNLD